jgi:hypothetical protein
MLHSTPIIDPSTPGALTPKYYSSGVEGGIGSSYFDNDVYTMGDLENNTFGDIRANS